MAHLRVGAAAARHPGRGVCGPAQRTQRQANTLARLRVSPWQGLALQPGMAGSFALRRSTATCSRLSATRPGSPRPRPPAGSGGSTDRGASPEGGDDDGDGAQVSLLLADLHQGATTCMTGRHLPACTCSYVLAQLWDCVRAIHPAVSRADVCLLLRVPSPLLCHAAGPRRSRHAVNEQQHSHAVSPVAARRGSFDGRPQLPALVAPA